MLTDVQTPFLGTRLVPLKHQAGQQVASYRALAATCSGALRAHSKHKKPTCGLSACVSPRACAHVEARATSLSPESDEALDNPIRTSWWGGHPLQRTGEGKSATGARGSKDSKPAIGRGDDTVGNPHRAQISQFELFELILLLKLDK